MSSSYNVATDLGSWKFSGRAHFPEQRGHCQSTGYTSYVSLVPAYILMTTLPSGYLAIHVLGFLTGTLLLPPSPSMFRRYYRRGGSTTRLSSNTKRQPGKAAIELSSYSSVWWILFSIASFLKQGPGSPVSRRLVSHLRMSLNIILKIRGLSGSRRTCRMYCGSRHSTLHSF